MNEKFLVLERSIQSDLEVIEQLYDALGSPVFKLACANHSCRRE
jgi:hypothetical protein